MGLMDWLFPSDLLTPEQRRKTQEGQREAHEKYAAYYNSVMGPGAAEAAYPDITQEQWAELLKLVPQDRKPGRAVSTLTLTGCRSEPAPTWQHTTRIGPPPETHKHRMARLIARRERSGR